MSGIRASQSALSAWSYVNTGTQRLTQLERMMLAVILSQAFSPVRMTSSLEAPIGGFEPRRIGIKGIEVKPGERREFPTLHLSWAGTCQPQTAPSEITMVATAAAATVTGLVEEFKGPALSDIRVQLRSYADLHHPASIITDANGHYRFRDVAPGKYTISTLAIGHYDQGFDIYVYPGFDVLMSHFGLERCETLDCIRPFGLCT